MSEQLTVEEVDPGTCVRCIQPIDPPDYGLPLCETCREALCKLTLPRWVLVFTLIVGGIFCYALLQFPGTIRAGIAYERGRRAEAKQEYA